MQRGACGVPVFGVIPLRRRKAGSARKSEGEALLQALTDGPHSAFTEAFRILRTSLRHWAALGRGGVLLVTSPHSGDGKTTVALSLASVLAAEGKRVLVIDADMTRARARSEPANDGATLDTVLCARLAGVRPSVRSHCLSPSFSSFMPAAQLVTRVRRTSVGQRFWKMFEETSISF